MAVEDGATLGMLLNRYNATKRPLNQSQKDEQIARLLHLYQNLRKSRIEILVAGAAHTRHYYHLPDGAAQQRRDEELAGLAAMGWNGPCGFNWGDAEYQKNLLGFDATAYAAEGMKNWDERVTAASQGNSSRRKQSWHCLAGFCVDCALC